MNLHTITIDWGTSNMRAQLVDANGEVQATVNSDAGVGKLERPGMERVVAKLRNRWPEADENALACGMIGSTIGFRDCPYVPCPAGAQDLATHLTTLDMGGLRVHTLPGVSTRRSSGDYDVMRGEELQAIGWAERQALPESASAACVHPGTHSKWIHLHHGRIDTFSTAMTGELYEIIMTHSLLRHLPRTIPTDDVSFERGLAAGFEQTGIARRLFQLRAESMLSDEPETEPASYVSGLLIGAEIADALASHPWTADYPEIQVIGAEGLGSLYVRALEYAGRAASFTSAECAATAGFGAIMKRAGKA